ncbi:MAG: MBOAT family protein [Clostridia bacterium]|nr:MBOAT family protein [Clostridia bacterium]
MVFSSVVFLFRYLPLVLLLYFAVPKCAKNFILFVVSLLFYAWGEPVYVVLMIFSTLVDYTHGLLVDKYKKAGRMGAAKAALISSVIINLALLGFFKYSGFVVNNINALFGLSIPFKGVALPIGISFYTFQTMSYTIDVYTGAAKPQKNIISFGAYVALFPQLIAGPIVQYKTIAEQLEKPIINSDMFSSGIMRFVAGLGKKVLLANTAGEIFDTLTASGVDGLSALGAWLAIIAYTFQIYFDFSGYSDMAIGLGRIFGFKFLENFNYPYMSKSVTEFWRRWHISLGSWFRDYVYIPLGGNRTTKIGHIRNILIVWLLTGVWHGANWNFIFWGVYYGLLLLLEKFFLAKHLKRAPGIVGHIYTLLIVVFGWVFFVFESPAQIGTFFAAMFGANGALDPTSLYTLANNIPLLIMLAVASTDIPTRFIKKYFGEGSSPTLSAVGRIAYVAVFFIICTAFLVNSTYNPFLYFRF